MQAGHFSDMMELLQTSNIIPVTWQNLVSLESDFCLSDFARLLPGMPIAETRPSVPAVQKLLEQCRQAESDNINQMRLHVPPSQSLTLREKLHRKQSLICVDA